KVLDPACGSGSFLIKVFAELKNFYGEVKGKAKEIRREIDGLRRERIKGQMLFIEDKEVLELEEKYSDLQKEINEIKFSGTFALRNNIYGVDLDPKAIDITAFTLMVQVYDELKEGARCPTMIGENLKIGNSLVSAITPDEKEGFISRVKLERFKDEIGEIIRLREIEKSVDVIDELKLRDLIKKDFGDVVDVYLRIKEKYPNAIHTSQQKLLDEWYRRAKKEQLEKTYDILINQTGLVRIFLKEVYFERIEKLKERIENEIDKPLIRYFNSQNKVSKDREFEEILRDREKVKEELRFIKDRAMEISKSQPPKVFNWEIEFSEVFFDDGRLKENPGFDCVVGNPPWGRIKELPEKAEKMVLSEYFRSGIYKLQRGNINLYKLFLERNYDELKTQGNFSMIWPATFLGESDSIPIRAEFLDNNTVKTILHFPVPTVYELFDKQLIMEATVLTYKKERQEDYEFLLKTEISIEEARNLGSIKPLRIKHSELRKLSDSYQIPIFKNMQKEWAILDKLSKYPKFGNANNGKPIGIIGVGHLDETIDKQYMSEKPTGDLLIRGVHVRRYFVDLEPYGTQPRWVKRKAFLKHKPKAIEILARNPKIVGREMVHRDEVKKLYFSIHSGDEILSNAVRFIILEDKNFDEKFILALLNSQLLDWNFRLFSQTYHVKPYEIEALPIIYLAPEQQSSLISLVSAITQKKKEYHAISQNLEDYIEFKDCRVIRLDDFVKNALGDFSIVSSIKVKNDNFDVLRVKIDGKNAVIEYGIKRKIEEYEIEEEQEIKGKYIIEWHEAGNGKIKDSSAVEFLAKVLKDTKNFSKAKQKSIWQKIAEVKVPEFSQKVKEGFLRYKSAMKKAKELDEEITKIDRAIDRLVYDLYGLTEEERKVVEKSVWGDRFEDLKRGIRNCLQENLY
ncbi:N-6 DNA methylase, partial [Dehalococcoidia bacterium]|nr:N-6 DNA methylase [Dehalococcoidia bacterium]